MTSHSHDRTTAEKRLWAELANHNTCMLGLDGGDAHFQPMTAFAEPETGEIWFFTRTDTDLAKQVGDGHAATMIFQSNDLQACIDGRLTLQHDRARIDKYWNAVVAAWYPDGKEDPHLTMLRLDGADAQLWITDAGPLKFMWEIAKANVSHRTPDLGDRANLSLQ